MVYSNESRPSPPRTFFCYWDWCRLTFTAVDDLASHVRHDHIRTLQPMNKQEIMRMRKWDAEEAQSMLDSSGHSVLVSHHKGGSELVDVESVEPELAPANPPHQLCLPTEGEETGDSEYHTPIQNNGRRIFRSGTLCISPLPQHTKYSDPVVLQTQAPYQSQSQSHELSLSQT